MKMLYVDLGISISKIRSIGYLIKICCQKVKNQHFLNGRMDILVTSIELIRFLNRT